MILKLLKILSSIGVFFLVATLLVHLFDSEFAGKFTISENTAAIDKGRVLYKDKGCLTCHGAGGINPINEDFPNIAGQPRKYTEQQLKDIRDGRRNNGGTSLMKSSVSDLTNEEAYLISLYLSTEPAD